MTTEQKKRFIINFLYTACIVVVAFLFLKYLLHLVMPFVAAFIISAALQRPVNWFVSKTKLRRKIMAPIVTILLLAVLGGAVFGIGYAITMYASEFAQQLPQWYMALEPKLETGLTNFMDGFMIHLPPFMEETMESTMASLGEATKTALVNISANAVSWVATKAGGVPSVLLSVLMCIIAVFFISGNYTEIKAALLRQLSPKYQKLLGTTWHNFGKTIGKMGKAYLTIMGVTFIELSIALVVLRVPYAFLIAAMTALVDIFPVLGIGTVLWPWAAVTFISGNMPLGFGLVITYLVIAIVRQILEPRIVSNRIG
ncbi:MAG: AI-2E family transporter, partial [Oscillospiraceae bacterium]|nr:AI-2E family transporter [Oscillospiraceae bacterium]